MCLGSFGLAEVIGEGNVGRTRRKHMRGVVRREVSSFEDLGVTEPGEGEPQQERQGQMGRQR